MKNFIKGIDSGTAARTIFLMIALLNQLFAVLGIGTIDIGEDAVYQLCSAAATIAASSVSWWKNNNFTQEAQMAQRFKEELKSDGIE